MANDPQDKPETGPRGEGPAPAFQLDPHMRRVALMIGYMVILAGFATGLTLLWPFISGLVGVLSPFIVALIVAYLFNPIVNFVQRRLRLTRVGGIIVVVLIILLAAGSFIGVLLPILTTQSKAAYVGIRDFAGETALPWAYKRIYLGLGPEARFLDGPTTGTLALVLGGGTEAPETTGEEVDLDELRARVGEWLVNRGLTWEALAERVLGTAEGRSAATSVATEGAGILATMVGAIARGIAGLVGSVIFLVFVLLVSFYLLIDFAALRGVAEVMVPVGHQNRFFEVAAKVDTAVGGFIRGQITSAIIVGILTFIGLWVLGMKQYAVLIGCLAAVGNLIPYLGPVMGATPAVLYMLATQDGLQDKFIFAVLVIGLFAVIQSIDGFILQPKIVGTSAQLHPVAVIASLALGAPFGLIGMVIAVPVACVVRVLLKEFYWDPREKSWRERTGNVDLDDGGAAARGRRGKPARPRKPGGGGSTSG